MGKDSSADGMGRTRGRQLGPLTRMLPDLVELELSWLISTSITPHCTRERVSKGRGSPAGFSGSVSQEDVIAGPGGPDLGSLVVGRSPMGDTGLLILSFRHL